MLLAEHNMSVLALASDLPKSALHYVIRTQERVVLDDASVRNSYSDDEYLEERKPNPSSACRSSNKRS